MKSASFEHPARGDIFLLNACDEWPGVMLRTSRSEDRAADGGSALIWRDIDAHLGAGIAVIETDHAKRLAFGLCDEQRAARVV
jgi:hypothetical protein